jgi:hypothetical protein
MDELRFRGKSYPVGTQTAGIYVICIDTSADPSMVVPMWEVCHSTVCLGETHGPLVDEAVVRASALVQPVAYASMPLVWQYCVVRGRFSFLCRACCVHCAATNYSVLSVLRT